MLSNSFSWMKNIHMFGLFLFDCNSLSNVVTNASNISHSYALTHTLRGIINSVLLFWEKNQNQFELIYLILMLAQIIWIMFLWGRSELVVQLCIKLKTIRELHEDLNEHIDSIFIVVSTKAHVTIRSIFEPNKAPLLVWNPNP